MHCIFVRKEEYLKNKSSFINAQKVKFLPFNPSYFLGVN